MEILIVLACLAVLGYVLYTMFFKKAKSIYDETRPPPPDLSEKYRKEAKDRKESKDRKDKDDD